MWRRTDELGDARCATRAATRTNHFLWPGVPSRFLICQQRLRCVTRFAPPTVCPPAQYNRGVFWAHAQQSSLPSREARRLRAVMPAKPLVAKAMRRRQKYRARARFRNPRGWKCRWRRTAETWTHWGLNPGPSACEADVIPLHHKPKVLCGQQEVELKNLSRD